MTSSHARSAGLPKAGPAPHLDRLSLRNYRNFEELDREFPEGGVAIVGPNGSGKTNLLEAIYYLEVFRSFRGAPDRQLVRFGAEVFRVEGTLAGGGESVAAAYDRGRRVKKVEVGDRDVERISDGIGRLGVVVFRLEDAELVRDGPSVRRRFLDVALSLTRPAYLAALQRYRSLLSQRNEALKSGVGDAELAAWSEGLIEAGATITAERDHWIREGRARYAAHYERISGGDRARMRYVSSIARSGEEDAGDEVDRGEGPAAERPRWAERFRAALAATRNRERRRGMTVVGPHRDDVNFTVEAEEGRRDLRRFGSSGQQRTGALALRLLEADRLGERLGREPIYLLDDVFAELDEGRSGRLLEIFDEERPGQVILTAPKPGDVALRGGSLERWRIRNGRFLA